VVCSEPATDVSISFFTSENDHQLAEAIATVPATKNATILLLTNFPPQYFDYPPSIRYRLVLNDSV